MKQTDAAPIVFERATLPSGDWRFLRVIENALQQLEERLCSEIDLTEGFDAITISGSIECYRQIISRRVIELTKATALLWKEGFQVGALLSSRALLETIISFHDFCVRAKKAEENKDYEVLGALTDEFVLSTRDPDRKERLKLIQTPHILKQLKLYGEFVEPQSEKFYAQISDMCHPNGYAMLIHYGSIKDRKFITGSDEHSREHTFQGIYNCIYQICWFYSAMDDFDKVLDRIRYLD